MKKQYLLIKDATTLEKKNLWKDQSEPLLFKYKLKKYKLFKDMIAYHLEETHTMSRIFPLGKNFEKAMKIVSLFIQKNQKNIKKEEVSTEKESLKGKISKPVFRKTFKSKANLIIKQDVKAKKIEHKEKKQKIKNLIVSPDIKKQDLNLLIDGEQQMLDFINVYNSDDEDALYEQYVETSVPHYIAYIYNEKTYKITSQDVVNAGLLDNCPFTFGNFFDLLDGLHVGYLSSTVGVNCVIEYIKKNTKYKNLYLMLLDKKLPITLSDTIIEKFIKKHEHFLNHK